MRGLELLLLLLPFILYDIPVHKPYLPLISVIERRRCRDVA